MDYLLRFLQDCLHQRVQAPGGIGGQCVDVCNLYLLRCWGLPHVYHDAVDWQHAALPGWRWVANAPTNAPHLGDLIVWGPTPQLGIGSYGHIAIVIDADRYRALVYEQNWGGVQACEYGERDYTGVLGWQAHP